MGGGDITEACPGVVLYIVLGGRVCLPLLSSVGDVWLNNGIAPPMFPPSTHTSVRLQTLLHRCCHSPDAPHVLQSSVLVDMVGVGMVW